MCGATPVYIVDYRVKTVGGLCQCYWLDTPHKYLPHFPQLHFTKYSKHVDIGSYHIYQMSVFRRRGCQGDYYRYSWGGDGHGREVMDMVEEVMDIVWIPDSGSDGHGREVMGMVGEVMDMVGR